VVERDVPVERLRFGLWDVVKIAAAVLIMGGMWTTQTLGQRSIASSQATIERHIASIDSSLVVARLVYMSREEIRALERQADSTHAAIRERLRALEVRINNL